MLFTLFNFEMNAAAATEGTQELRIQRGILSIEGMILTETQTITCILMANEAGLVDALDERTQQLLTNTVKATLKTMFVQWPDDALQATRDRYRECASAGVILEIWLQNPNGVPIRPLDPNVSGGIETAHAECSFRNKKFRVPVLVLEGQLRKWKADGIEEILAERRGEE